MSEYLTWAIMVIYVVSGAIFYFKMLRVGRILGGDYRVRMDVALTLAVAIPFFLTFIASSSEELSQFVGMASMISLAAGFIMIPGVLMDFLTEKKREEEVMAELDGDQSSFDSQVREIMERQRAKRVNSSNNSLKSGTPENGAP